MKFVAGYEHFVYTCKMEKGFKKHCRRHAEVTSLIAVTSQSSLGQYLLYSSRKSTPFIEPDLAVCILMATGLRAGEVLNIRHCDILDEEHVYIRPFKRGRAKTVVMPVCLVKQMIEVNPSLDLIFTIPYKKIYDHCKRKFNVDTFLSGEKNLRITHTFRHNKIREFLIKFENPLSFIVNHFGWLKKESVAYYL